MNTLNQTPQHPANEELAAFALGRATPNAETIAEHVAHCSRCETLIAKTPRDTFLGMLNQVEAGSGWNQLLAQRNQSPIVDELPDELRRQTKYTFLKKLGGGGMGVVYLAQHNLMKRKVAVKLIPPQLIGNPTVRERFLREVVSAAALEHPNVVRAYSAEEFGPYMLFEMEFVDGKDLREVVKSHGPLPVAHAVNYIRQAALALQDGMQKAMVHRDIKPGNLLLTRTGAVKVADFGLAKFSRESDNECDTALTGVNTVVGTPDYMAPEQFRNAKGADIRADIYSLGCTFCYLLTGRPPFAATSVTDLFFKHWQEARPDVGSLRHDVPAPLARYLQKMMAPEPGNRPQTPKEVAHWLGQFAKGGPSKQETGEQPKLKTDAPLQETADQELKFPGFTPEPRTRETTTHPKKKQSKRKWPLIAGVAASLLAVVLLLAASGAFSRQATDGTIVLENLPAGAEVLVDGRAATLTSNGKTFELRVAAAKKHRLEVKKDGFKAFGSEVEVAIDGRKSVDIHLEPIKAQALANLPKDTRKKETVVAKDVDPNSDIPKTDPIVDPKQEPKKEEPKAKDVVPNKDMATAPDSVPNAKTKDDAKAPDDPSLWALNEGWMWRYKTTPDALSFSPDGQRLVAVISPALIYVLDANRGTLLGNFNKIDQPITACVAGPDQSLVIARQDDTLIWDLDKKAIRLKVLRKSHSRPCILTKGQDAALLVPDDSGGFTAVSLKTGAFIQSHKTGTRFQVTRLVCSEDEKTMLVFNRGKELLVKTDGDAEFRELTQPEGDIQNASLSRDGKLVAMSLKGGPIRIVQITDGKMMNQLDETAGETLALEFLPDGNHLVSIGRDNMIRLWDLKASKQLASLKLTCDRVHALALSSDGKLAAVSGLEAIQMIQIGSRAKP